MRALKRIVLLPSRLHPGSVTLLLPAGDEDLQRTGEKMSPRESSSASVLVAPEAARTPKMVSMKLRRLACDDIAEITGGSFSRPYASVTCDGRTTSRRAALLRAPAGRTHLAG